MSLRARLIAALLVLATAGLVTLAAVTYAEQRSFLLDRVDQQAHDAARAVQFQLLGPRLRGGGTPFPLPGVRPGAGPAGGRPVAPPPPPNDPDNDGNAGSGPQGLPGGTVGQVRDASGKVVSTTTVRSYESTALPPPDLPDRIGPGETKT